ncbi:hypothetical protein ACFE04_022902 [Oxalis oulophora]
MADVVSYEEHMMIVRQKAAKSKKGLQWVQNEHGRTFASWFSKKVSEEIDDPRCVLGDTVCWLSYGSNHLVFQFKGYIVNGLKFNTEDRDNVTTVQNNGVTGGDNIDDEPNCLGVGEGTLLRKSGCHCGLAASKWFGSSVVVVLFLSSLSLLAVCGGDIAMVVMTTCRCVRDQFERKREEDGGCG